MDAIKTPRPTTLPFSALGLEREAGTGRLLFVASVLASFCQFNNLDPRSMLGDEDLSCWLIVEWYCRHREDSGETDPVAEEILAEVAAEEASGIAMVMRGGIH